MKKRNLYPLNLQFFADEPEEKPTEPEVKPTEPEEKPIDEKPQANVNEQLQAALIEIAKQKRAIDKLAKENGELTKKYRATLSEQEAASLEKAEAEAQKQAEFDEMKRKLAINDLVTGYMDREYPRDIAEKLAIARLDGDKDTETAIEKQMDEARKKKVESELLKKLPQINAGGSNQTITKEQFDHMTLLEKSKLRKENEAEYNRLIAL